MTDTKRSCCAGSRKCSNQREKHDPSTDGRLSTRPATAGDERTERMQHLSGGTFRMGTDSGDGFPQDGEGPIREVTVDPFYIDKYTVTNAEFLTFIQETDYTTDAENYGWSFVF